MPAAHMGGEEPEMLEMLADRHMEVLQSLGWPCHRPQPDLLRFDVDWVHYVLRLHQGPTTLGVHGAESHELRVLGRSCSVC